MNEPVKMTPEHLERAARMVCRMRGLDPDERVGHGVDPSPGSDYVPDCMVYSPRWARVAREVKAVFECVLAVGETAKP